MAKSHSQKTEAHTLMVNDLDNGSYNARGTEAQRKGTTDGAEFKIKERAAMLGMLIRSLKSHQ
jgi:hypothetical protein